jgi:acetylornithine deacetylase
MSLKTNTQTVLELLFNLIRTPSFSTQEAETATILMDFFHSRGMNVERYGNNILVRQLSFDPDKPNILICSHHDTVEPNDGYTLDPFDPFIKDGKLYGLGSNDAGGSLVAMIGVFLELYNISLPFNLLFLAAAEEEISGLNGVEMVIKNMPEIHLGIVGEPTGLEMAIAERGLLVIDATAHGIPGHAAHNSTVNPIYKAQEDIQRIKTFSFDRVSPLLGESRAQVTQISAGHLHNQVPASCGFVIDVRINELYTNKEIFDILKSELKSELKARSFRLNSSRIDEDHPFIRLAKRMNIKLYGSPTTSDQAVMPFTTVKFGCGDSRRSHTADEYIYVEEIEKGINSYLQLLKEYQPMT